MAAKKQTKKAAVNPAAAFFDNPFFKNKFFSSKTFLETEKGKHHKPKPKPKPKPKK